MKQANCLHKNIAAFFHKCSTGKRYSGPEPLTVPKSMAAIKLCCLAHLCYDITLGSQQSVLLDELDKGGSCLTRVFTQTSNSTDKQITWVTFTNFDLIIETLPQHGWRSKNSNKKTLMTVDVNVGEELSDHRNTHFSFPGFCHWSFITNSNSDIKKKNRINYFQSN